MGTPPPIQNPIQAYGQMVSLQDALARRPLVQEQIRSAQLENRQREVQARDQDVLRQAYIDSQGDTNKWLQISRDRGVSPMSLIPVVEHATKMRQAYANADEAQLKLNREKGAGIASEAQGILGITDPDPAKQSALRSSAFQGSINRLVSGGFMTPQEGQQHLQSGVPADQDLQMLVAHGLTAKEQADLELNRRREAREQQVSTSQVNKNEAETAGTKLTNTDKALEQSVKSFGTLNPATPEDYNAWRAQQPDAVRSFLPQTFDANVTPKVIQRLAVPVKDVPEFNIKDAQAHALLAFANQDPKALEEQVDAIVPKGDPMNASTKSLLRSAATRGDFAAIPGILKDAYDQRGRVQVAKESAQNRISLDLGSLGGSTSDPSQMARAVAEYRVPLSQAVGRGGPAARGALMNQVLALNPDFQEQYYNAFQKTENDAVAGKMSESATALNKMMGHLSVLKNASDALGGNDLQALNRLANWIGVQTGKDPVSTYNTIVHRVGPEVTKAYLAAGGSVGERGTNEEDFAAHLSPQQRNANIGVSAQLADSMIRALQAQYTRGTYGKGRQKLISDEAESARQRLAGLSPVRESGAASAGSTVTLKDGRIATFPDQKAADAFKKAHPDKVQ
jgi:hypothetical protein